MTRRQLNVLLETDTDFAVSFQDALEDAADMLEAEAWRRALEGVSQPIMNFGKPVMDPVTGGAMMVRRYSDTLLMLLLRGSKPEKFSTRAPVGGREDPMLLLKEIAADDDPPRSGPTTRQSRAGQTRKP